MKVKITSWNPDDEAERVVGVYDEPDVNEAISRHAFAVVDAVCDGHWCYEAATAFASMLRERTPINPKRVLALNGNAKIHLAPNDDDYTYYLIERIE